MIYEPHSERGLQDAGKEHMFCLHSSDSLLDAGQLGDTNLKEGSLPFHRSSQQTHTLRN
jgi:hypothetical protein